MDEDILKKLKKDEDGLSTYEYIANNIGNCDDIMPQLIRLSGDREGAADHAASARPRGGHGRVRHGEPLDLREQRPLRA